MPEQAGTIYAVRNDRLGGRLGAMLNAKRIADDYGAQFRFTWASHDNVSPELQQPEMLFSQDFLARHRENDRPFGELQQQVQSIENSVPPLTLELLESRLSAGADFRCNEAMSVVSLPWEQSDAIAKRVSETLETLDFTPKVIEAMKTIRARLGESNLVAYHLRRGDIIDPNARPSNVLWPNKYISRVFYETHIARTLEQNPNTRIVVFSDSDHELAAFMEMSDQVIAAPSLLSDDSLHILQRDFLELYIMSRCQHIIGPGASAFSSVAAMLGNSQVVDIRQDLTSDEHDIALDELTDRLEHLPEAFSGNADIGQNFPDLIAYHRRKGTAKQARRILKKHLDAGFTQSYIYDLLAEEYFYAGDADGALHLIDTLKDRPILTDLGNSASYAWAGLAAFAEGNMTEAVRLAHVSHWLQPILPISRILVSALYANGSFAIDNQYPLPRLFIAHRPAVIPKFRAIAERIKPDQQAISQPTRHSAFLDFIPFELELRDWVSLQSIRLPSQFWNVPNQLKTIRFFTSTYRSAMNEPAVMSVLGQLHCQAEDEALGAQMIKGAYQLAPHDAHVNLRLARLMLRQQAHKEAQNLYDAAVELSNGQICFRAEQGLMKLQHNDKEAAFEIFRELADIDHQMIEVLILTADILRRKGKYREIALQVAQKADRLVPGGARTGQILRKILQQLGRGDEAKAIRAKLLSWKRSPGNFSSRIN